jgi:precorrin-6x reductase
LYGTDYDVRLLRARNDGMLAEADAVVAVLKPSKTSGGTASAVRKAQAMGLPIVHLNPERRTVTLLNLARTAGSLPNLESE